MKKALVTGGSGLIGSAICKALAAEGLHVLVHANQNLDRARQVVEKIQSAGQSAETAVGSGKFFVSLMILDIIITTGMSTE